MHISKPVLELLEPGSRAAPLNGASLGISLVSSGPSACNTASVSSKSYNKLLSLLAGNGSRNPSVVGKHDVRLWDMAIQGAISPAGIYGVLAGMKRGPEPLRHLAADPSEV